MHVQMFRIVRMTRHHGRMCIPFRAPPVNVVG